ncbi:adenosylcobyric acid synthase (glutamine-hydrolysing) [Salsuginibacillus halophilus]|uniref:Cobyric acid synthase n=2 Tax=Salsuginibacillus halophilus TaxID=517424 RepID=A0A2P8HL20_9BACI|nr:adenosylcobyric acid synthase (glutamine-hydrolysing) [Salsuginibacillus halophilus]
MIQGTHSDAGKSVIVTALCRIFAEDGWHTAPFKSQNMALNSYVTAAGEEIGRAQGVQAEAAGIEPTTDMNPILLKPTGGTGAQVVLHGKPYENMSAGSYRKDFFETGLEVIHNAYNRLAESYDAVVIEGAGSPAEINLNDRELVNMRVANIARAPVILVGDIEKGGVFASLVGTLQLLEAQDRAKVKGVMINKFRGDVSLLEPGIDWFEAYTGIPVLGIIPYEDLTVEAEDSVALDRYTSAANETKELDIAVIRHPHLANFTDIDPFFEEPDCHVRMVQHPEELGIPDMLLIPGSKSTLHDLAVMKEAGLFAAIGRLKACGTRIVGICGGYQMLGLELLDEQQLESKVATSAGLGLLPISTTIAEDKTTIRTTGNLTFKGSEHEVSGYEIHMGVTKHTSETDALLETTSGQDGAKDQAEQVIGTYLHGLFHNDAFREYFLNDIRETKGLAPIYGRSSYQARRESGFDQAADLVRRNCRMDAIYALMDEEK